MSKIPVTIDGEVKELSAETIKGLTTDLGYEVELKSKEVNTTLNL